MLYFMKALTLRHPVAEYQVKHTVVLIYLEWELTDGCRLKDRGNAEETNQVMLTRTERLPLGQAHKASPTDLHIKPTHRLLIL
jgi:hypothetical protein